MKRVYFLFALFAVALAAPQGHNDDNQDSDDHHGDYTYDPWFQAVLAQYNISEDTYHPEFESVTLQTGTKPYVSCGEGHFVTLNNLVAVVPNPETCEDQPYCVDEESCKTFATTFTNVVGLQLVVTAEGESGDDKTVDLLANLDADDEVILYVHDQFYVAFYKDTVQGGSAYPEQAKK